MSHTSPRFFPIFRTVERDNMSIALWITGIAVGIVGIVIFNPLLTLIGIGLSLTTFLVGEPNE